MSSVPDYRGEFLRGLGGNSDALGVAQADTARALTGSIGYQAFAQHTYGPGDGGTGQPFWIYSGVPRKSFAWPTGPAAYYDYATNNHNSDWQNALTKYRYQLVGDKDSGYSLMQTEEHPSLVYNSEGGQINFDVSRVWPVSNEFRPVNKAVRYLIKAR